MAKYAALANSAEQAAAGVPLREAFIQLLVLLWQDNEPEEVETMWREMASRRNAFGSDALEVLVATAADPPTDLIELMSEQGWISVYAHPGDTEPRTFAEAVEWLRETHARFAAVYEAVHPGHVDQSAGDGRVGRDEGPPEGTGGPS